jgi:hypothetical protein
MRSSLPKTTSIFQTQKIAFAWIMPSWCRWHHRRQLSKMLEPEKVPLIGNFRAPAMRLEGGRAAARKWLRPRRARRPFRLPKGRTSGRRRISQPSGGRTIAIRQKSG